MREWTDAAVEKAFAERYAAALTHLRAQMDALGLHQSKGWRISETTAEAIGGFRLILRPIHSRLPSPEGIECIVWIDEGGRTAHAECEPGGSPA